MRIVDRCSSCARWHSPFALAALALCPPTRRQLRRGEPMPSERQFSFHAVPPPEWKFIHSFINVMRLNLMDTVGACPNALCDVL